MIAYPKLIERPIVINGNSAVIGRPVTNIDSLLSTMINPQQRTYQGGQGQIYTGEDPNKKKEIGYLSSLPVSANT